jgi:hypothetical protein
LLVHNVGTALVALVTVLASRSIGHIIVELEIAVELGSNVDRAQGELVTGTEGRGLALVRATDTADTPASTLSKATTEASTRGPAVEVEVLVLREGTSGEIIESEASLLLVGTLVVGVLRASEGRGVVEWESGGRAGSKGQETSRILHDDVLNLRKRDICDSGKRNGCPLCGVGVLVVNLLVEAVWWLIQSTNGGSITCQGKHKQ